MIINNKLETMKKFIILILMFNPLLMVYGQDTISYLREGKLEYALVQDSSIYIPFRPNLSGFAAVIRKSDIYQTSSVIRHICSDPRNPNLPFAWCKNDVNLFSVAFWHSGNGGRNMRIYYRIFETRDSLEMLRLPKNQEIKKESLFLTPLKKYFNSFYKVKYPGKEELKAIENSLSFDIYAQDSTLVFYLRDKDAFYIWDCLLPTKGEWNTQWNELAVFTAPAFDMNYVPRKFSDSYTGTKTIQNSIKDSLFFNGHLKVIDQNNEKFIINREHGSIYYLGKKEIEKIGNISLNDYYFKIKGKRVFIEDRDNRQIIFFAPVEWSRDDLPKPKVKIITNEKEFKEMFKYVLE